MRNVFCFILYCNFILGAFKQSALHFMFFALEKKNEIFEISQSFLPDGDKIL